MARVVPAGGRTFTVTLLAGPEPALRTAILTSTFPPAAGISPGSTVISTTARSGRAGAADEEAEEAANAEPAPATPVTAVASASSGSAARIARGRKERRRRCIESSHRWRHVVPCTVDGTSTGGDLVRRAVTPEDSHKPARYRKRKTGAPRYIAASARQAGLLRYLIEWHAEARPRSRTYNATANAATASRLFAGFSTANS
jgi:hypothetical protein